MKKFLLLALGTVAMVSCKTVVPQNEEPTPNETSGEVISLMIGSASRTGNEGVRDTIFAAGDQIGVMAAYPDDQATPTTTKWIDTCFDNRPALWLKNEPAVNPTFSEFVWGPAGQGGMAHNQYYPGKKKKMYIYAYYPYSDTSYIRPTSDTETPKLKVKLTDGTIKGETVDVNKVQADVLYYISGSPVSPSTTPVLFSSDSKMSSMKFNHALAQLRFVLKRPKGASAGKFVKLVFKTTKNATMDITTGAFNYGAAPTHNDAVYTITPKTGDVVDIPEEVTLGDPNFKPLDILKEEPLMIFPLALADAKLGSLVLTVDFSKTAGTPDEKDITVDLTTLNNPLVAGNLNTYTLSVNYHVIELKASITPWGKLGSNSDLDAE